MVINPYIKNNKFFQQLAERINIVDSSELDLQFKLLKDYINNVIVNAINEINEETFKGISEKPNSFLMNNWETGTTSFEYLGKSISPYSISASQILSARPNSIIFVKKDGSFVALPGSDSTYGVLQVAPDDSTVLVGKINSNNIQNNSITGAKIAFRALNVSHLHPSMIFYTVPDNFAEGKNFVDAAFTTEKGLPNSYTIENFGPLNQFPDLPPDKMTLRLSKSQLRDNTITFNKLADKSVGRFNFQEMKPLKRHHFKLNFLTEDYWRKDKFLPVSLFVQNFKITGTELGIGTINHEQLGINSGMFEPDVAKAFLAKGCIGNI